MISPERETPAPNAESAVSANHSHPLAHCRDAYLVAILLLLAILPFANTLVNGFVYDDNTQVLNNPYVQDFARLGDIFSTTVWSYVGAQGVTNYYRPMMTFSYLVIYQAFGPMAYPFHLASVLLHAGIVCLLFLVTVRLTMNRLLAMLAAGLFALHPIHTESVAWIAAVTDLQLTLFFLLAFWFYIQLAAPGGARRPAMQAAMTVSYILAIISKEQSLMLPVLATAYEHCFREDRQETSFRQKAGRYYLLWLVTAAYLAFRVRFFGALAPVLQISDLTWSQTILSSIALVGQYMGKLLWPAELCAFYVFHRSSRLLDPRVLAGVLALCVLAILFVILWKRARAMAFALIWMTVTLAPVLNPRWMAANVFTERYLYLPSIGFCWLAAWGWVSLWEGANLNPIRRRALVGVLAVIAAAYTTRIVTRNRDWSDDVTLYAKTLAQSPDAYHIRNNLGTVLWKQGNVAGAEREWQKALALSPKNAIVLNNLGLVKSHQKKYEEAIEFFQRATRMKPSYTDPHLNLGAAFQELGRPEANVHLRAAVALSPLNVDARNRLGKIFLESGRLLEAKEQFANSAASQPNWAAFEGLGEIESRNGEKPRAERHFRRAIELNPLASSARFALAAIYASAGRKEDAKREYTAGLSTDPTNADARANLLKLQGKGGNGHNASH